MMSWVYTRLEETYDGLEPLIEGQVESELTHTERAMIAEFRKKIGQILNEVDAGARG